MSNFKHFVDYCLGSQMPHRKCKQVYICQIKQTKNENNAYMLQLYYIGE